MRSKPRIHYVIATWWGRRVWMPHRYKNDPTFYVKRQLETISKFRPLYCEKVVVVLNRCRSHESAEERSFWRWVQSRYSKLNVEFVTRGNDGWSYGAWVEYHRRLRASERPTHYLLMEDDYELGREGSDEILLEVLECENAGYVCGLMTNLTPEWIRPRWHGLRIAAMSCGLMTVSAMDQIKNSDLSDWSWPQVQFSEALIKKKVKMADIRGHGTVCFRYKNDILVWYLCENSDDQEVFKRHWSDEHLVLCDASPADKKRCIFRAIL